MSSIRWLMQRHAVASVLTLSGAQAAIGLSSLLRLPFVISALGQDGFGLYFALGNLAPLLLTVGAGMRIVARTLTAESRGHAGDDGVVRTYEASLGIGRVLGALQIAVCLPIVLVLPLRSWLGAESVVSAGSMSMILVMTVVMCGAASSGGASWGKLEADGRLPLVHTVIGAVAVGGLFLTIAAVQMTDSFVVLTLINVLTSAAPFYVTGWLGNRSVGGVRARLPSVEERRYWRASLLATLRAGPAHATRTLDPFIIAAALGPAAAAVYAIAQRLSLINTLAVQALAPLIASVRAEERGRGIASSRRSILQTAVVQGGVAALAGGLLVLVGPMIAEMVTGGDFTVSRTIFVVFMVLGATYSMSEALAAMATGPVGFTIGIAIDGPLMVVNVGLSLLLVHEFGVVGPVWASIAAATVAIAAWSWAFGRHQTLLTELHVSYMPTIDD